MSDFPMRWKVQIILVGSKHEIEEEFHLRSS
jgi:hypothetical protein